MAKPKHLISFHSISHPKVAPDTSRFLQKLVREKTSLFVHWRIGMTGTFA
ncbi:MAG: hypothetical protein ACLPIC_17295 [Rhodoblastus sp.]